MAQPPTYARLGYRSREVRLILAVAALVLLSLDSTGVADYAADLPAGAAGQAAQRLAGRLDAATSALGLDRPRLALHAWYLAVTSAPEEPPVARPPVPANPAPVSPDRPAPTTQTVTAPAPEPRYSTSRPLRVLFVGDSQVDRMESTLRAAFGDDPRLEFEVDSQIGTGLSRPDHRDWPAHMVNVLRAAPHDVVISFLCTNDPQNITEAGVVHKTLSPSWIAVYQRRLEAYLTAMDGVRHVYWIGLPRMKDQKLEHDIRILAQMHLEACRRHPNVTYFSSVPLTSDSDASYTSRMVIRGRSTTIRSEDGMHFTKTGYRLIAGPLVERILDDTLRQSEAAAPGGQQED
jgi:hypothetical protein